MPGTTEPLYVKSGLYVFRSMDAARKQEPKTAVLDSCFHAVLRSFAYTGGLSGLSGSLN